jgi:hypothetical protein
MYVADPFHSNNVRSILELPNGDDNDDDDNGLSYCRTIKRLRCRRGDHRSSYGGCGRDYRNPRYNSSPEENDGENVNDVATTLIVPIGTTDMVA